MLDLYVEPVPAQQRRGKEWFRGSADALYQSLNVITDEDPDFVCVFGGDHIYKMDVRQMFDFHLEREADLTVAAIPVPIAEASAFGVLSVDDQGFMRSFDEKPDHPREMPDRPGYALVSMGNYIFTTDVLIEELTRDAGRDETQHDFGRNILPEMVGRRKVCVYDFSQNELPGRDPRERGYWRDVGTIEAYWEVNMDLAQVVPIFDLYNTRWPLRTWTQPHPPAKFVFADQGHARMGIATDSLVSEGCIISGGRIDRSVLSPGVRIHSFAHIEESILFEGSSIGRHARVRRAIVDKNVAIPAGVEIGYDPEADRRRFHVSEGGIVVIPKGTSFEGREVRLPSELGGEPESPTFARA
jgi:glucose-1-phosphate adenylyltransferase